MHALLGGAHVGELRRLQADLGLQLGDPRGDFQGQGLVALGQGRAGRALVAGRLVLEVLQLLLGHPPLGHQRRQVVPGAAQGVVGVADFLVEDAQRIGVHHGGAGVIGRAAEESDQFREDRHPCPP